MDAAIWLAAVQDPVKLVALGEAAIQTFADSKLGFDHATAANRWFNEFPGPELDRLRKKAQEHQTFIVGQCRARDSKLHLDRESICRLQERGVYMRTGQRSETFRPGGRCSRHSPNAYG